MGNVLFQWLICVIIKRLIINSIFISSGRHLAYVIRITRVTYTLFLALFNVKQVDVTVTVYITYGVFCISQVLFDVWRWSWCSIILDTLTSYTCHSRDVRSNYEQLWGGGKSKRKRNIYVFKTYYILRKTISSMDENLDLINSLFKNYLIKYFLFYFIISSRLKFSED